MKVFTNSLQFSTNSNTAKTKKEKHVGKSEYYCSHKSQWWKLNLGRALEQVLRMAIQKAVPTPLSMSYSLRPSCQCLARPATLKILKIDPTEGDEEETQRTETKRLALQLQWGKGARPKCYKCAKSGHVLTDYLSKVSSRKHKRSEKYSGACAD